MVIIIHENKQFKIDPQIVQQYQIQNDFSESEQLEQAK
jgi:hypothetical protein